MKKIVVFEDAETRRYLAPRLSLAYLFVVLCNVLVLVLPFVLLLNTDGELWQRYGAYREQPDVKFQYKFIMVLEATSSASGQTKEVFVSTVDSLNVLRPESYRTAIIKHNQDDADFDGRLDSFALEAEVPLAGDEQIMSMQAMLFLDYRLQDRVKFDTEAVAYTSCDSALPLSGYDTQGSLVLRQANPLGVRGYFSELYADETPLVASAASISGSFIEKYRERRVAADYFELYPIKHRAADSEENGTFRFKMNVDVPEQEVLYIPTPIEVLKDGWIKYLSVLVVVWLAVAQIKSFAFRQQLLYCKVSSSLPVGVKAQKKF